MPCIVSISSLFQSVDQHKADDGFDVNSKLALGTFAVTGMVVVSLVSIRSIGKSC